MPIITPNQTAVILADGSARRIGAMIGTTTTAISMKSRKNPSRKITAMTTMNCVQNPPGSEPRKSRTNSSPPNARNAEVNMAAPIKMINTIEVVFAVSTMTPCMVFSILNARQPLQTTPIRRTTVANAASTRPITSSVLFIFFMFRS